MGKANEHPRLARSRTASGEASGAGRGGPFRCRAVGDLPAYGSDRLQCGRAVAAAVERVRRAACPARGGPRLVLRPSRARRGQVCAIAGRAGDGPAPPGRAPASRFDTGEPAGGARLSQGAPAPRAARGVRLPVPRHEAPGPGVRGAVPGQHRWRQRLPAPGGQ